MEETHHASDLKEIIILASGEQIASHTFHLGGCNCWLSTRSNQHWYWFGRTASSCDSYYWWIDQHADFCTNSYSTPVLLS